MAVKTALHDYGRANDWRVIPERVRDCRQAGHGIFEFVIRAKEREVQCSQCGYSYVYDGDAEFRLGRLPDGRPRALAEPIVYVPPEPETRPTASAAPAPTLGLEVLRAVAEQAARAVVLQVMAEHGLLVKQVPETPAPVSDAPPPGPPEPVADAPATAAEEAEDQDLYTEMKNAS